MRRQALVRDFIPLVTQLLLITTLASLFVFISASAAQAVVCSYSGPGGNWAINAAPAVTVTDVHGNFGNSTPYEPNIEDGSIHVQSLYIWHDANDMVEYGWSFDKPMLFTHLWVFDARMFGGDYADRVDFEPSQNEHAFRMLYNNGAQRYDFKFDGNVQNFHRDPTWVEGRPTAVQEIGNQCDQGTAHWSGLKRQRPNGDWDAWNGTGWICDSETGFGYDHVSATEFRVSSRPSIFTGGCNSPFDAPNPN